MMVAISGSIGPTAIRVLPPAWFSPRLRSPRLRLCLLLFGRHFGRQVNDDQRRCGDRERPAEVSALAPSVTPRSSNASFGARIFFVTVQQSTIAPGFSRNSSSLSSSRSSSQLQVRSSRLALFAHRHIRTINLCYGETSVVCL
uniref:Secreted protein n=1 Tax=Steinernema glaseri TaxID=37863 RepID=A0A1I7YID8_9BILA